MINENGAIKVSTALDEKMQKELLRGSFKMSLTFIILGAVGVALFLALEIVSIFLEWEDDSFYLIMTVLFAIILGSGISITVTLNKNLNTLKGVARVNTYEFYRNYFMLTEILNGEQVGSAKIYNTQIIKSKETKNYLFLYINAGAAYPVDKSGLSETELNTLKSIFRLGFSGATVNLTSEPVADVNNDNAEETSAEPEDPFGDLKN